MYIESIGGMSLSGEKERNGGSSGACNTIKISLSEFHIYVQDVDSIFPSHFGLSVVVFNLGVSFPCLFRTNITK